ncbi:MAG TPA: PIG-L family deacetylase [Thermoanaerobaculia bacterium]|nr:PIG-L family deacetylase [Thermoanaerobaculia bacterium]
MSATSERLDLIVVSPHLDDAVLSCGGRLAATSESGGRARVVTLFAGDDPVDPVNPLANELRRIWELEPGEVMAARRAEDLEACRRLGVEADQRTLLEALYRTNSAGAPLYPTLRSLYGSLSPQDAASVERIAVELRELPPTGLLLAPLGVGGHVDHLVVRHAAEASGREVAFYEEFPYSEWKWFAVARALGRKRDWRPESMPLTAELLERKREAILAYRSQVPAMFRAEGRLGKQLRRHARRAGGERIWRPVAAPAPGPR